MKKFIAPLILFIILGLLLAYGLKLDPRKIPSPLIGKSLPAFSQPTVADPARRVSRDDLKGRVYLLNVWASWCVACRQEHPLLNELSRNKTIPIIGLNYKDKREDALGWLGSLGDPYELSLADPDGRLGIDAIAQLLRNGYTSMTVLERRIEAAQFLVIFSGGLCCQHKWDCGAVMGVPIQVRH